MKVIADRAASWRMEVECDDCRSILELAREDIQVEDATDFDRELAVADDRPFDPLVEDLVIVLPCPSCKQRMLLDPSSVPAWLVDEAIARRRKN